jgi:SEC-C motif
MCGIILETEMIAYHEKTTDELIDLLIQEEDRVTLEHIQELIARPDAIEPLRRILLDQRYWRDTETRQWWVEYHAFTILSATSKPELLPDVVNALVLAYETDYDWISGISSVAISSFGEPAVEPLMRFVREYRDSLQDKWYVSSIRSRLVNALTHIALKHPPLRDKVTDFLCSLVTDPSETEPDFLGLIVDKPLLLNRERGMAAARDAYERNAVDEMIQGDFDEMVGHVDDGGGLLDWESADDLFEFYQPDAIAQRQQRWKKEREDREKWAAEEREKELARVARPLRPPSRPEPAPYVVPDGYSQTETGALVRQEKTGRNDPCPCGSGKKYKKCCGR